MGNKTSYKFTENELEKNIEEYDKNILLKDINKIKYISFIQNNSFFNEKNKYNETIELENNVKENRKIENNENIQNKKINELHKNNLNNIENDYIQKINKENFYTFDENLNSNNIIHPCHAQWFLFWIFASYLNEYFTETEKEYVYSFYSYFPDQCINGKGKNCYTEFLNIYPLKANNREELMKWIQIAENYCRKKANIPLKNFNYKKLLNRWRYDDGYV